MLHFLMAVTVVGSWSTDGGTVVGGCFCWLLIANAGAAGLVVFV